MKHVVIVAYEFYPTNTGGSHRPFRMANFLQEEGFKVTVFSPRDISLEAKKDLSLQNTLEEAGINVKRTDIDPENWKTSMSKSYYFNTVDDTFQRWEPYLLQALDKTNNTTPIDAILVTTPPFSMTQAVASIKKVINAPVLLDMRDAWSQWNIFPYASKLHYNATLKKERESFEAADKVIATSKVTLEDFRKAHPNISKDSFLYIPNSFDEFTPKDALANINDILNIGYVGSFYYDPLSDYFQDTPWYKKKPHQWFQFTPEKEFWKYRSPYYFFQIIQQLIKMNPKLEDKVRINFVGNKPVWFDKMVEEFGISNVVNHLGRFTKSEVAEFEKTQDFLLITSSKREHRPDYSIAGKTFEYLSNQTPILACVTKGAQRDILEPSGLAVILDPDQARDSAKTLADLITGEKMTSPDQNYIRQYLSKEVLKVLSSNLKTVLSKK